MRHGSLESPTFFALLLHIDEDLAIRAVLFRLTEQFETRYASQIRDAERDENRPHDHQPDLFDGPDFDDPLLF